MSADNGIYICAFADGYRVRYAHAIENIYNEDGSMNKEAVLSIFKGAPIFKFRLAAADQAALIQSSSPHTEYGICFIDDFLYEDFPHEKVNL